MTTLGSGHPTGDVAKPLLDSAVASCGFRFELDVERGHGFYTVTVARREASTYSAAEISRPGALDYELGN